MNRPRLLYLGFAFPPGWQQRYPEINPAGHRFETEMMAELGRHFEVRAVAMLPFDLGGTVEPAEAEKSPGVPAHLCLVDKAPELWHRARALGRLKAAWRKWRDDGWSPDAILVYNFSPIYNAFLRWLKPGPAKRVVLLADSNNLGLTQPWLKRFRRQLKPYFYPDAGMLRYVDAGIGLSQSTERFFTDRALPWLWMPGGCDPKRAVREASSVEEGPVRFGYFGSLAPHSGVSELLEAFGACSLSNTLHLCGYGKQAGAVAQQCQRDPRLKFHGLLPTPDDCLEFAQSCDVLINPRPEISGNENNFPSKVFEYALSARAILTTGFAGVKEVLGPQGFYLDEKNLRISLVQQLQALSKISRRQLQEQGRSLQQRILTRYSWANQAGAMADFVKALAAAGSRLL